MKGLTFYDKQHIQKVLAQQNDVANIFNRFILSITPYLRQWDDRGGNSVWVRNQSVEKRIDNELMNLASQLMANISLFQIDAWKRSDAKNDDFIRKYIEGMSINTAAKEGMFAHNLNALAQLQNDFDARGNKLSTSVWNLADQTKTQLEYYLKTGLSTGQNAARISQDVRQILNEPDKRFRRIRNDKGMLVLSQPMRDYHPGQGVYRSSKMNALRLTATTTNMAYRAADYDRWSKQDFVLGIQIQRSANNRGPCKLCDSMVGEYPKTFKFTGFHPFCTCIATPIVMKPEELADFLLDGTIPESRLIKSIPKGAEKFIDENRNAIKSSYWYNDNFDKEGKLTLVVPTSGKSDTKDIVDNLFVESKSIEDAQNFAKQFVKKSPIDKAFKGEINYSGLSIENANEINKALSNLYSSIDATFISGIKVISPTSAQGKKVFKDGVDAIAAYNPIDKGIFLNKEILKNNKTFSDYVKKSNDAWGVVMSNIEKLSPAQKEIASRYKKAGRSLVDESIQGCITHELGHHIQWQMLPVELNNKLGANMSKYADRISGYATASKSEYIAESIAAYIKGETSKIDPALVEYLNGKNKRKITINKPRINSPRKPKTPEQKADIQKRWVYRKVVNTENEIRLNKKFETGVVYDNRGNVIIDKRGKATSVQFTEEECAKMKDCIFTHNHPRGWGFPEKSLGRIGNSFSPADIMLAVAHDVSEMRAVTPNYTFVMKRPSEGWGISIKSLKRLIEKENESLKEEFYSRIYAKKLAPERASAVHYHILWKRIADKTGWSYYKSKTR